MKTNRGTAVAAIALALLAVLVTMPLPAQELTKQGGKKHHHYKLIDLGTFGGPQSFVFVPPINFANVLNNHGTFCGLCRYICA